MAGITSRNTDEDLVYILASRLRCNTNEAKQYLDCFLDSLIKCLTENGSLHIRKFGMFHLKEKRAAKVKNFKNQISIVKPFMMVRFTPALSLKEKVNKSKEEKRF